MGMCWEVKTGPQIVIHRPVNTEKAHIFTPAASFYRKKTLKESRWLVQGHIGCSTKQKETETLVLTSPSPQLTKHD